MSDRTAVIMQPTYLPWIGYLDLVDQSDCFVFLDSVQFDKRSWQQRNRIKGRDGILWLTVPVLTKGRRDQKIVDVRIDPESDFGEKHVRTISHCYAKAPFWSDYREDLERMICTGHTHLADLNIALIAWLCRQFGIQCEAVRSSTLGVGGTRSAHLINICEAVGASRYLSPPGSRAYIEEENLLAQEEIELVYHAYEPPTYRQLHDDFVPYLSVLDLLLNEGPAGLSRIRAGRVADGSPNAAEQT